MKGKKGNHIPPEARAKKSKPRQEAPPIESEQQKLLETEQPVEQAIRNNFMVAEFVYPHLSRDKDDKAFIAFEISFPLTEEHRQNKELLPPRIIEAWDVLAKHGYPKLVGDPVPAQDIELALAPDTVEKHTALKLHFAEIEKVNISVVEAKGDGKSKDVTRLHFRAKVEMSPETWRWAAVHFSKTVWVRMAQTQGSLLEEESAAA